MITFILINLIISFIVLELLKKIIISYIINNYTRNYFNISVILGLIYCYNHNSINYYNYILILVLTQFNIVFFYKNLHENLFFTKTISKIYFYRNNLILSKKITTIFLYLSLGYIIMTLIIIYYNLFLGYILTILYQIIRLIIITDLDNEIRLKFIIKMKLSYSGYNKLRMHMNRLFFYSSYDEYPDFNYITDVLIL